MNNTTTISNDALTLLHRINTGDERVLSTLYSMYFKKLLYYGMSQLNDEFAVTNIIHECFIKAWDYRATMQRVDHFYFFIRMNMKWHFQKYYANARYRFYRATFLTDRPEEVFADIPFNEAESEDKELTEEKLEAIYKVIPLLPMNRNNVLTLHYRYGLMSYTAIAKRIGLSNKKVIAELEKSIKSIQSLVGVRPQAIRQHKTEPFTTTVSNIDTTIPLDGARVMQLRKEGQTHFDEIARIYQTSKANVLNLYLAALKECKQP